MNALIVIVVSVSAVLVGWLMALFFGARRTVQNAITRSQKEDELVKQAEQRKQKIDDETAKQIREVYSAPRDNVIQLFRNRMLPKPPDNKPS